MRNSTETFVNRLDRDLINPYSRVVNAAIEVPEEKVVDKVNVMNKLEDINEIIKNTTMKQLDKYKHKDSKQLKNKIKRKEVNDASVLSKFNPLNFFKFKEKNEEQNTVIKDPHNDLSLGKESVNKMLENFHKAQTRLNKSNLQDKDNLFLKDFKHEIHSLDKFANNINTD
jgi:hypothetical protein